MYLIKISLISFYKTKNKFFSQISLQHNSLFTEKKLGNIIRKSLISGF